MRCYSATPSLMHSCVSKQSPHLEVLWSGAYPVETLENVKLPRGFKLAAVINLQSSLCLRLGYKTSGWQYSIVLL